MNYQELFIQRCFDLANLSAGMVTPNPRVGAVITYNNKIIGEGYHQYPGGPHAEINAINSLINKGLLSKSTIYVSLEPCNNHGKTPPCVDAILRYKIPNVVISVIDPNPHTMGKSVQKLKAAGINVITNILPESGKKLSKGFFSRIKNKRPYVILKFAQSKNKKMGIKNSQIWISNPFTKRLTHKWRSETNCILVGSGTIITDNPKLDNRLYYGNSPVKLLLKRDGVFPSNLAAFKSKGQTIVIRENSVQTLKKENLEYWQLPFDKMLLPNILTKVHKKGLNSILVEGGSALLNSFLGQNLWDELRIFTNNKIISHPNSIDAPSPTGILVNSYKIDDNLLDIYENKSC